MRDTLKTWMRHLAPALYLTVKARRARTHSQRLERRWGCVSLTRKILRERGASVQRGPFAGLVCPPSTFERHLAPKLFGTYERELHPTWQRIFQRTYSELLDVGCAEGYYAVGLARQFPNAIVHAFDTDPWARRAVQEMGARNATSNLKVHGICDPAWLAEHLKADSFILSDCEGYEDQLFMPDLVPRLRTCDLLVELHERPSPGVTARLLERFRATHSMTLIPAEARHPAQLSDAGFLSEQEQRLALREYRRDGQQWLFLEAKKQSEL